jgi:hypothetical protein
LFSERGEPHLLSDRSRKRVRTEWHQLKPEVIGWQVVGEEKGTGPITRLIGPVPFYFSDPIFWGSLVLGPIFSASLSWGFFDLNLGINGLNFGPNLLALGRQGLSTLTGNGFRFGLPSFNVATPLFDFTRSIDVGAFLSGSSSSSDIVQCAYCGADSYSIVPGLAQTQHPVYRRSNTPNSVGFLADALAQSPGSSSAFAAPDYDFGILDWIGNAARGAVVGTANVGQAFWALPRALGLTDLIGIEGRLKQQDVWLADQWSSLYSPDSWQGRVADAAAKGTAGIMHSLAGEGIISRAWTWGRGLLGLSKAAPTIHFGKNANQAYHAFRHVVEKGMSPIAVQTAIEADIAANAGAINAGLNIRRLVVDGKEIAYNAFKFADETINVGSIKVP